MNVPVTFKQLGKLQVITDFNEVHGTSLNWDEYFQEIGITGEEAFENRELEYELYLRWVALRNSPLMKALS